LRIFFAAKTFPPNKFKKNELKHMLRQEYEDKVEWAKHMRMIFSPSEMLHSDGTINQE